MTVSERVYQALLIVYPQDHRQMYGDPMVQLFRDRMRRDGGGFGTLTVWFGVGFDLLSSAFRERMETIMDLRRWTSRWWETSVVLLGVNSIVFGIMGAISQEPGFALGAGFLPGGLLLTGLALKNRQRLAGTITLVVGAVAASFAWWAIYTVVLALVVVIGGFRTGKIGPLTPEPEVAA